MCGSLCVLYQNIEKIKVIGRVTDTNSVRKHNHKSSFYHKCLNNFQGELRVFFKSGLKSRGAGGGGGGVHSLFKGIRGCAAVMFSHLLVFIRVINSRF